LDWLIHQPRYSIDRQVKHKLQSILRRIAHHLDYNPDGHDITWNIANPFVEQQGHCVLKDLDAWIGALLFMQRSHPEGLCVIYIKFKEDRDINRTPLTLFSQVLIPTVV
jgi:hypothetical protein